MASEELHCAWRLHQAFAHEREEQPQLQLASKVDFRIAALERLDAIEHVHPSPAVVWSCAPLDADSNRDFHRQAILRAPANASARLAGPC